MKITNSGLALSGLLALSVGCASTGQAPSLQQQLAERGYVQGDSVRNIQNYRLNGWNHLDSRHLIIETGPSDRYLVSLRTTCHQLSSAQDIGFTDTAGQLTRFDSVIFTDSAGMRQDCPIDDIHRLQRSPEQQ